MASHYKTELDPELKTVPKALYDGSIENGYSESLYNPRESLDSSTSEDSIRNLENGLRTNSSSLSNLMRVRPGQKESMEKYNYDSDLDVDGGDCAMHMRGRGASRRRTRNWYNYCVFGGIGGMSILGMILLVNLALTYATFIWSSTEYLDPYLKNWGRPGSGTEGLAWYPSDFTRDIVPISCHSHNDYWRQVPLFSALRAGCTGVEADVWLFDDDLYVGHNTASLTRNRTFTSLYIDPLVEIITNQNKQTEFYNGTSHGVFDADPGKSLTLLVDVKTPGPDTWPWVLGQLEPLRERGWLSFYKDGEVHVRQVTVVGTGNTPFDVLTENSTYRDTFFDAPIDKMWEPRHPNPQMKDWPAWDDGHPGELLESDEGSAEEDLNNPTLTTDAGQGMSGVDADSVFNSTNSYYASVSFNKAVGRVWRGRLSPKQMRIIRGQVRGAHRRGLKARYWGLPAWPLGLRNHVWDVLVKEGVDMLNVDDLRGVSKQVW